MLLITRRIERDFSKIVNEKIETILSQSERRIQQTGIQRFIHSVFQLQIPESLFCSQPRTPAGGISYLVPSLFPPMIGVEKSLVSIVLKQSRW